MSYGPQCCSLCGKQHISSLSRCYDEKGMQIFFFDTLNIHDSCKYYLLNLSQHSISIGRHISGLIQQGGVREG